MGLASGLAIDERALVYEIIGENSNVMVRTAFLFSRAAGIGSHFVFGMRCEI